jgi:hypothetical protein
MIFDRELNAQASATPTGRRRLAIVDVPEEQQPGRVRRSRS